MKNFAAALLLIASLTMAGCGSSNNSSSSGNVNGTWNATLTDTNSNPVFKFGTSLQVNGDNSVTVSGFSFNTSSGCFTSGETETGSFILSGNFNGNVTGKFQLAVQSGVPSGNNLTLVGAVNGNTITGTWTLTGSTGCTGTGTFTMNKA